MYVYIYIYICVMCFLRPTSQRARLAKVRSGKVETDPRAEKSCDDYAIIIDDTTNIIIYHYYC